MTSRSWKQFIYQVRLGERQEKLRCQFIDFHEDIGKELANIYLGAIKTISDTSNPDRFAQSAHYCRELMSVFKIKVFGRRGYSVNKDDIKTILEASDPLRNPPQEMVNSLYKTWNKLYSYFSKIAHHEEIPRPNEFSKNFEELEETFLILTKPSVDLFKEIDKILKKKINKKVAQEALKKLKNAVLADYFYGKVPYSWLEVLENEGVFKNPASPIVEDNTVRFPPWPPTKLLLKAVDEKPQKVMKIIEQCEFPSDSKKWNIYVLIDFTEIALRMPSKIAKKLVNLVEKQQWLKCPHFQYSSLPEKLSKLMMKLADENEINSSLKLANILLDVTIKKEKNRLSSYAQPFIGIREYNQILRKKILLLSKKAPLKVVKILADKLNKAICLENKVKNKEFAKDDSSTIWRPAIENNPQNWGLGYIKNSLVITLKNLLESIGNENKNLLKKAIKLLDNYRYPIFVRIKLHIYRKFPKIFKEEIRKAVIEYFDDLRVWHEYQLLISQQFYYFSKKLKRWYLSQIEKNQKHSEIYQLRRLQMIKKWLDKEWRDKLENLVKKYGKVEHADFLIYHTSEIGPTSPVSIEALEKILKNKKIEGIINYLKKWESKRHILRELSVEELGRNLEKLIKKYPEEFSKKALLFVQEKLSPVYIYYLFRGLQKAIKEKKKINWGEIIKLMKKIISKKELYKYEKTKEIEPDWDSVFRSIMRLLNTGFFTFCQIPFRERKNVWKVIKKLTNHPEPTLEYEEKYKGDNMNPATLSISTVRGEAIHGVINYALWCSKNLNNKRNLPNEVRKVLEEHLDIRKEPILAIRAVYGWKLPYLIYLNKNWVKKNINQIFPKEEKFENLWLSAFGAYLINQLYIDAFKLLEKEYEKAIFYLNNKKLSADVENKLTEHLMVAYVYNISNREIIDRFFSRASTSTKAKAISFIGNVILSKENLKKNKNKINLKRVKLLLKDRIKRKNKEELKEFGSWFINSPFDKKWNIEKLYEILKITGGKINWVDKVIEELKNYIKINPLFVTKCLYLISEGDKENWKIYFNKETYKEIILELIKLKKKNINKEVRNLINRLVEKGFLEFKELLPSIRY